MSSDIKRLLIFLGALIIFFTVILIVFIMTMLLQINRTSELARVFGIDFFSVLSRGSQYRVESMFLRLAHAQNYVAISPGTKQVFASYLLLCLFPS